MTHHHHTRRSLRGRALVGVLAASAIMTTAVVSAASASEHQPRGVVTLQLYSAQGYDSHMVSVFNAANPGINVVLTDGSTGPLITKVTAEEQSGSPKWNMMWADGATWAAAFDTNHWTLKNIVPSGTAYNAAGKANEPKDKGYAPTGLTAVGGLCYDKNAVSKAHITLPKTWAQLKSVPKGSLGMNDPSFSGPTFPLIAGVMAHLGGITYNKTPTSAQLNSAIAKGEAFYLSLKKNGLQVHHTNGPTLAAMESNPPTLDMATIQTSACYGDIIAGAWPTGAVKYLDFSVALPSSIVISSDVSAAQRAAAEKFVAFVLSKKGEAAMQAGDPVGDGLFWPVISGVNPEKGVGSYSAAKAFQINPAVWGPKQSAIDAWFTAHIA